MDSMREPEINLAIVSSSLCCMRRELRRVEEAKEAARQLLVQHNLSASGEEVLRVISALELPLPIWERAGLDAILSLAVENRAPASKPTLNK